MNHKPKPTPEDIVKQLTDMTSPGKEQRYASLVVMAVNYHDNGFYVAAIVEKFDGSLMSMNYHPLRTGLQETSPVKAGTAPESLAQSIKSLDSLMEIINV